MENLSQQQDLLTDPADVMPDPAHSLISFMESDRATFFNNANREQATQSDDPEWNTRFGSLWLAVPHS